MKTSAIVRIVVWSCIGLVLISVLLAGLGRRSSVYNSLSGIPFLRWSGNRLNSSENSDFSSYSIGSGSVAAAEISQIEIDWIEGRVIVQPTDGNTITFEETSNRQDIPEEYRMRYAINGNKLSIQYCDGWRSYPLSFFSFNKTLVVSVPRELLLDQFSLEAVSASVQVEELYARQTKVTSVSGSIKLSSIQADELDVELVSGSIRADAITATMLDVESVSGSIEFTNSEISTIDAEVVSGAIRLSPGANVEKIDVESISGSIRVSLPENSGFTARYSSAGGRLQCDFPVTTQNKTITYLDGSAKFHFETVSGNMQIEKE